VLKLLDILPKLTKVQPFLMTLTFQELVLVPALGLVLLLVRVILLCGGLGAVVVGILWRFVWVITGGFILRNYAMLMLLLLLIVV
jgi:hypothetical protein